MCLHNDLIYNINQLLGQKNLSILMDKKEDIQGKNVSEIQTNDEDENNAVSLANNGHLSEEKDTSENEKAKTIGLLLLSIGMLVFMLWMLKWMINIIIQLFTTPLINIIVILVIIFAIYSAFHQ